MNIQEIIEKLGKIQSMIIQQQIQRNQLLQQIFRDGGMPELADKIEEYGSPTSIYVSRARMEELSFLAVICPLYVKDGRVWDKDPTILFSWVKTHSYVHLREKDVPLMKRISLIPIEFFVPGVPTIGGSLTGQSIDGLIL